MSMFARSMIALFLLLAATPSPANFLVQLSFEQKMAESDLVIVGTVTSVSPRRANRYDATATVRLLTAIKGTPPDEMVVLRQSPISEADPRCCEIGATYIMFLRWTVDRSALASVNGPHGMIRIGPARNEPEVRVIRDPGD